MRLLVQGLVRAALRERVLCVLMSEAHAFPGAVIPHLLSPLWPRPGLQATAPRCPALGEQRAASKPHLCANTWGFPLPFLLKEKVKLI